MKRKAEKYHIFAYLCALVLVGILVTGVSLARYAASTTGEIGAGISSFACSYSISDASSLTFSDSDYWLKTDDGKFSAMNTARSVRFDIRNYTQSGGEVDRISAVDVAASVRFYAPSEFVRSLAVQVVMADSSASGYTNTAVTPQYVLADLIAAAPGNGGAAEFDTSTSVDYDDRSDGLTEAPEETLSVSGGMTGTGDSETGRIVATSAAGDVISISAETSTASYSVGFMRTNADDSAVIGDGSLMKIAPAIYIDCEKYTSFMTVDISLPEMRFEHGKAETKTFVLYITSVTESSSSDLDLAWDASTDDLLVAPKAGDAYKTLGGARVVGYHFDRELPVCGADGAVTGDTDVRVSKTYDYESGGASLSYDHIAPPGEGAASVAHAINDFFTFSGSDYAPVGSVDFSSVVGVQELYGTCSNGGTSGYIDFSGLSDDPYYDTYAEQTAAGERVYEFSEAISKGYSTLLNVLFIQASEAGGGNENA